MKLYYFLSAFIIVGSCAETRYTTKIENLKNSITIVDRALVQKYAATITADELKRNLFQFSSNDFEGRATGEIGQKKAVHFIKSFYQNEGIKSPINDSVYYQRIPKSFLPEDLNATENVVAYIKGSEKPEEVLIISGHHDHLGIEENQIYVGADDNGSGTVAMFEMAEAFKQAELEGHGPKRSVMFLHLTAEEIGLQGSLYYTQNPLFKLENTIANLNIDMIGRVDKLHLDNPNYIYIIGADRLSKELHYISDKVNSYTQKLVLEYKYNEENDNNRYYYRSDHYNFAKHNIPVIFYFNGEHEDYHEPSDTPDKIDYNLLEKRTKLIFATAWQLANQDEKLLMNVDF
jgi:Zn-dependent M28 family amino/carboxypeptidase